MKDLSLGAKVLFDIVGLIALGWMLFHLILLANRGVVTIAAPLGEAPFEIGLISAFIALGIWVTISDCRRKLE